MANLNAVGVMHILISFFFYISISQFELLLHPLSTLQISDPSDPSNPATRSCTSLLTLYKHPTRTGQILKLSPNIQDV